MKITAVTTAVVNAQMRNWVVVKVSTDEGVVGWGEASLEVTLMAAIREAVGPEVDVMVDLHARTTPLMAIHYGVVLGPFRPFFLEEPCPPENVGGMAEVTRALPGIPIATGERLVTRWGFRELLERRACAVIQPDLCHCGGLWEARKIAAMAETYYVSVAPRH